MNEQNRHIGLQPVSTTSGSTPGTSRAIDSKWPNPNYNGDRRYDTPETNIFLQLQAQISGTEPAMATIEDAEFDPVFDIGNMILEVNPNPFWEPGLESANTGSEPAMATIEDAEFDPVFDTENTILEVNPNPFWNLGLESANIGSEVNTQ